MTPKQVVRETSEGQGQVSMGNGPPMAAKIRSSGPGLLSISFRIAEAGPRLVGDVGTVKVGTPESTMMAEIVSVSVMGYVEVCQARVVRHVAGPPFGGADERRSSTRHEFDRRVDVKVQDIAGGPTGTVRLGDISAGGCGLEISRQEYRVIGSAFESRLTFSLPKGDEPYTLIARRRNTRALSMDLVFMGLIWTDAAENGPTLARLRTVLNSRQN